MCQGAWEIAVGMPPPLHLFSAWWCSSNTSIFLFLAIRKVSASWVQADCAQHKNTIFLHNGGGKTSVFHLMPWCETIVFKSTRISRTYWSYLHNGPIFRELQTSVSLLQFPHLASFEAIQNTCSARCVCIYTYTYIHIFIHTHTQKRSQTFLVNRLTLKMAFLIKWNKSIWELSNGI